MVVVIVIILVGIVDVVDLYDCLSYRLAVCLSKYAGESSPLPYFDLFLSGMTTTSIMLL